MATRRQKTQSMVIPFCGPAYELSSTFISSQICRNFYLKHYPEVAGDEFVLEGTPGLILWLDPKTNSESRRTLVFGNYKYEVSGDKVLRIDSSKNVTELGTIGTSTGPLGMATNGLDLVVVDGTGGWVWDYTAETYTQITDPDFPACVSIIHTDGYYLVPKVGTGQIWRSDFNDGLSWGGLAFSTAGADPDPIVAISVHNRDVYTIGERTTEIWQNSGEATFNFVSIPSAFIQKGGVGPLAVTEGNNALYWISRDKDGQGQLMQCVGRVPSNKSTPAIIQEFQSWGDLSDIQMFSYEMEDHTHIVITSPSAGKTFVYDSTIGKWHERSTRILGVNGHWRISTHSLFNNLHLVGDFINGKIYELRLDAYDEAGATMVATRRASVIRAKQDMITVNSIELISEPGVGLESGEDEDVNPQAILKWSRDGGRTWSAEVDLPLGAIGETENRARTTQLGQGRNWVFEVSISAKVKRVITGAIAEIVVDG